MAETDPTSFHDVSETLPAGFSTFAGVEERLVEAMDVLRRSADRERGWLRVESMGMWRRVVSDIGEADLDDRPLVTCALTRAQVARADEALGWVVASVAEGETRQILGLALLQLARGDAARISWTRLWQRLGGQASGWTTDGLRKRYARSITDICVSLNARASAG